jgi:hypothetical protein
MFFLFDLGIRTLFEVHSGLHRHRETSMAPEQGKFLTDLRLMF